MTTTIKSSSNAITSELFKEPALPCDALIVELIKRYKLNDSGCKLKILIKNKLGKTYREINVAGMNTFIFIAAELSKLPLVDLRKDEICFDGIQAEFVPFN